MILFRVAWEVGRLNPLNSRETLQNNSEPNQQPAGHAKEGLALFWLLIGSKTKTDVIPTQNRKVCDNFQIDFIWI